MPRSRSSAFESIMRSGRILRASKVPDCLSSWSTSVVLPWSTCAMIATLRSWEVGSVVTWAPGREKGAEYTGREGAASIPVKSPERRPPNSKLRDQKMRTTNGMLMGVVAAFTASVPRTDRPAWNAPATSVPMR
jgi:hypothetical protein